MTATAPSLDVQSGAELAEWFRAEAPRLNALLAEWAVKAAEFEDCEGWREPGKRSCAHWFVDECGLSRTFAEALLRAGHCAEEFPAVREAFRAGDLSLEKVRLISTVATEDTAADWVGQAIEVTPPQLARQTREARTPHKCDDRLQRSLRHLRTWNDELGMVRISGSLPACDGAEVRLVLERVAKKVHGEWVRRARVELDPPEDRWAAHSADALVAICRAVASGSQDGTPLPVQMVVHVDADVLTGENPAGRGHIEEGPALSLELLETLGCDAAVKVVVERDGVEVGATRERRIVPAPLRRKVRSRDRMCRFPGCARPAAQSDAHHIWFWRNGGPTDLWNLLTLCEFDHNSLHRGEWSIERTEEGDLIFKARGGRVLGTATGGWWKRPSEYQNRAGP